MNSNETKKLCGQPHWWAWLNSPGHAHPPPILIDGRHPFILLPLELSNYFHWICNLFRINVAEAGNSGNLMRF
jgi:hypothetical protein